MIILLKTFQCAPPPEPPYIILKIWLETHMISNNIE